ncbi:hypothetical protein AWH62_12020 [Maricaulis sp. W15]|jgi:signal peptidase II|uniref:signal peptidase II n=1 Tax=Maricaulis TaxID=74317 RepID=UPI000948AAB6|nr:MULTISPECIES: signal peptidase II [Maricaulis]OLF71855.1 hypothetical protein AWH62_12020 [Maricaulis sp. W15]
MANFFVRVDRYLAKQAALSSRFSKISRAVSIAQLTAISVLVGMELITKQVLESKLAVWEGATSIFPGFRLTLNHNRGVSFGMLDNGHWLMPYLLAIVALILVVAVLIWTAQQKSKCINVAGVLFAAGGLANAIDRLGDGAVTDYLDFGWRALRWPTFNLADVFIFVGVALLLLAWTKGSQNLEDDEQ